MTKARSTSDDWEALGVGKFLLTVDQFAAFVAETVMTLVQMPDVEDGKVEERSDRSWRNPGSPKAGLTSGVPERE